jgi:hypothetical protein
VAAAGAAIDKVEGERQQRNGECRTSQARHPTLQCTRCIHMLCLARCQQQTNARRGHSSEMGNVERPRRAIQPCSKHVTGRAAIYACQMATRGGDSSDTGNRGRLGHATRWRSAEHQQCYALPDTATGGRVSGAHSPGAPSKSESPRTRHANVRCMSLTIHGASCGERGKRAVRWKA